MFCESIAVRNHKQASAVNCARRGHAESSSPAGSSSSGNTSTALAANAGAAISPNNPFGIQPGQLDAYSSGQDDFSSVPADIQRANIIALLDIAAPGTALAQQREAAYQKALTASTAGSNAASQTPAQLAQMQQSALMAAQYSVPNASIGAGDTGLAQGLNP